MRPHKQTKVTMKLMSTFNPLKTHFYLQYWWEMSLGTGHLKSSVAYGSSKASLVSRWPWLCQRNTMSRAHPHLHQKVSWSLASCAALCIQETVTATQENGRHHWNWTSAEPLKCTSLSVRLRSRDGQKTSDWSTTVIYRGWHFICLWNDCMIAKKRISKMLRRYAVGKLGLRSFNNNKRNVFKKCVWEITFFPEMA